MIQFITVLLKRLAVLLPGFAFAYLAVTKIYPYFDKRLPLALAIFFTYILTAYVIAPAFVRFYRILRPTKHLPLYCITPDGFASDPLNIGIIGTHKQLINAMEKAGWYVADQHSLKNLIRQGLSTVYGWSYNNAPVSSLYLFGRKQDVAFEIPIEGAPGSRHHVRFWGTTYSQTGPVDIHTIDWHHRREHVRDDKLLWVGAASKDVGIGFIRHNLQITHMIDPDTNSERDMIVKQLKTAKLVKKVSSIKLGKPYKVINRVLNGSLHTDGQMDIVTLKKD
jgi:hypothetical protein